MSERRDARSGGGGPRPDPAGRPLDADHARPADPDPFDTGPLRIGPSGVGPVLARAREAAGLTVAELSARTRIREAIIHAIEHDDFSLCGGRFYARGHVRLIAKAVGLDPAQLVNRYDELHGGLPETVPAAKIFLADTPIKLKERRSLNLTMILAVALAVVACFGVVRYLGGSEVSTTAEVRPAVLPSGAATPPTPAPAAATASPSPSPSRADGLVTVQVRTVDRPTGLSVHDAAGKKLFEGVMAKGLTATWQDQKELRLTIEDAGAVRLTVNGEDLGAPGKKGKRITKSFKAEKPSSG